MGGMDKLPKRKELRLKEYDYFTPGYYFVTICAKRRNEDVFCALGHEVPVLDSVGAAAYGGPTSPAVALTSAGKVIDGLIQNIGTVYPNIAVDVYCIMPDHVHLLLAVEPSEDGPPWAAAPTDIPRVINSLKTLSTKRFGAPFWQRGYYEHIIRNDADLEETRKYILENPLKEELATDHAEQQGL